MTSLIATLVLAAATNAFQFDARTRTCVNAAGEVGLNVGVVGPCADLRDQALAGESFDRLDLRGARFDGADLEGATFLKADLGGATFTGANLSRAVLTGAKLDWARLDRVVLRQAHLEHAQLVNTDLRGSDLRLTCVFHARFDATDLRGTRFSNSKPLLYGASFAKVVVDAATVLPGMTADQVMLAAAEEGEASGS
jgi:uncharacterized protein YjbI with pentapeptide repeats